MGHQHTVQWEEDDGYRFPSVQLSSRLSWVAWHSVGEHTAWVDGHIVGPTGFVRSLDVIALRGDRDRFVECDFDLGTYTLAADAAWAQGGVFFAQEMCLFTPYSQLTDNEIAHALARFRP